jgi:NADH dehydrogenase
MATRTVVVLGGTGFVGRHVVAKLVAAGHRVVVVTRRRVNARTLFLLPTVDVVVGDCHDPALLARVLAGADALVNLVGILGERGRATFERAHVELARTAIAACKAAGVGRFVQMSALAAAADAPSRYLRTKGAAEALVTQSGLAWTVFRPSVIFGRDDRFLNLFATLARVVPVMALGGADARFQPVWVDDVAACIAQAVDDDATIGQRYDLCGPQAYTLRELVRWTLDTAGTPRPILALPAGLARLQALVLEHLPGQLLTRDNLASMQCDSTCSAGFPAVFGITPTRLEAVAPAWIAPSGQFGRYDAYRAHGGR